MSAVDSLIVQEWRKVEEDINKAYVRPMTVNNLKCVLKCYEQAGNAWSNQELEECKVVCNQKAQIQQSILERVRNLSIIDVVYVAAIFL